MNRTIEPEATLIDLDAANARVNAALHPQDKPTPKQAETAQEKRSRITVPKLLTRYQERVAEQEAIASGAKEQIEGLQTVIENAERKAAFWNDVIAEIERGAE